MPARTSHLLTIVYAVAFAVALIFLVVSWVTIGIIRRLRIVMPQAEVMSLDDVPATARAALAPGLDALLALAFSSPTPLRQVSQHVAGKPAPQYVFVLPHDEVPAVGYVVQLLVPDRTRHYSILFVSRTR